jgi:hypothetical protein
MGGLGQFGRIVPTRPRLSNRRSNEKGAVLAGGAFRFRIEQETYFSFAAS